MLRLIISPPGTGKTTCITRRIKSGDVLIVPEQSHFETERMIYKALGARAFADVEILSFTKLCGDITARFGAVCTYAEETMREIMMLRAVREVPLTFYKQRDKLDFAARMLGTIGMFQREALSPEELLQSAADIDNPRLKAKITDLVLIYDKYINLLSSKNFSDKQDEIRTAARLAREHRCFRGKNIFIDSFDGFTGGQLGLITIALEQASSLTVTLIADKFGSSDPRYIISAKLAQKLKEAAAKRNIQVAVETPCCYVPERDPRDNTEIYLLSDIYTESSFVAAKIRELITTEGYSLRDIAVLNPPSPEALAGAFSAYAVTGFSDIPEAIIEKPVVRFIITALEAAAGKPGAVLEFIRSGFMRISSETLFARSIKLSAQRKITGKRTSDYVKKGRTCRLSRAQIQLLIRIAYEYNLDGEDWYSAFPDEKAEPLRFEIMGKLAALSRRINNTTGCQITEALAEFLLIDLELGRTVADIVYMGSKVDSALNDEYRRLWETVISVFEDVHSALKDEEIILDDYISILKSVFGKTMIARPPQVLDCVTVGDLRRTRTSGVKAVFLMGANQGDFPQNSLIGAGAEFTDSETENLCAAGIFISENRSDRYHRERFLINRAMTLPTEKLFITVPLRDAALKEKKPSKIISQQHEKIKNAADLPLSFWASHKNALGFQAAEKPHESALKHALKAIDPQEYERLFLSKSCSHLHKINPDSAKILMARKTYSPSRIETLNTCLFKYFCAHGLQISSARTKNSSEPDALTRGNLTHYVLEKVLRNHKDFMKLEPGEFIKLAEKYITEFEQKTFGGWARSARKKEILLAHAAGIAEVLKQMHEDFALSDFRPLDFEKEFEFLFGDIRIKGKIDRLDIAGNAIRVIDYKTGAKEFSFPEIEFGLNLQALIYLFAVAGINENYKPCGAFYRLVNGGRLSKELKPCGACETSGDLYKNRLETQRTTGLQFGGICDDIERINSKMKQNSASRREFIKLENLEEASFSGLAERAAKQLSERLQILYSGDVRAVPAYSKSSPCEHCDYKNICNNAGKKEEVRI
ncbi:MAG: PD-(D/E)XK nuclease family protein [Oscillospiraceae bacterium]|nr:PD-(D/E)XK nuclease family protein [Oscillospiraceae bacterium]